MIEREPSDSSYTYEHEVYNGFLVGTVTEVFVVTTRESGSNAMVFVHHACDAVKSKTIELVFLHPETQIAKEESKHFMISIVEQATIPKIMPSLSSFVEIQMISPIEFVKSVKNILAGMRMNDIK